MSLFPTRILLATDGSEDAAAAARTATELSRTTDSELHAVYVGPYLPLIFAQTDEQPAQVEASARETLDELTRRVEEAGGRVSQAHLRLGDPAEHIVALAESLGAGLVVVGSRGLSGMRRAVIGSVSESVVRHAHCPVLVMRGDL